MYDRGGRESRESNAESFVDPDKHLNDMARARKHYAKYLDSPSGYALMDANEHYIEGYRNIVRQILESGGTIEGVLRFVRDQTLKRAVSTHKEFHRITSRYLSRQSKITEEHADREQTEIGDLLSSEIDYELWEEPGLSPEQQDIVCEIAGESLDHRLGEEQTALFAPSES